jgi:hypothetical protein
VQDVFDASHPVKEIFLDLEYAARGRFEEPAFFWCHALLVLNRTKCSWRSRYRAPFKLHDVVQVTVLPSIQDLQTLTHWFICFAS